MKKFLCLRKPQNSHEHVTSTDRSPSIWASDKMRIKKYLKSQFPTELIKTEKANIFLILPNERDSVVSFANQSSRSVLLYFDCVQLQLRYNSDNLVSWQVLKTPTIARPRRP